MYVVYAYVYTSYAHSHTYICIYVMIYVYVYVIEYMYIYPYVHICMYIKIYMWPTVIRMGDCSSGTVRPSTHYGFHRKPIVDQLGLPQSPHRTNLTRHDINLDMLISLSESSLADWFSEVSPIRDNEGRGTVWLSTGLIIKPWKVDYQALYSTADFCKRVVFGIYFYI